MNQVVIGTAGHIDHGKTALVKAANLIFLINIVIAKNPNKYK